MPRPPRLQIPDGIYHVTSRGNRGQPTFLDPDDHRFHLWCLDRAVAKYEWKCPVFCHMSNHFHLIVCTPRPNLSQGMQWLNGLYAQVFNDRHGLNGHVFQGRFHAELIETDGHLLETARYDVLNPVRAGLCNHPSEWRWSSCRATLGLVPKPDFLDFGWLLLQLGPDIEVARQRYLTCIEDPLAVAAGLFRTWQGSDPGHVRISRSRTLPRSAPRAGGSTARRAVRPR